MTVGYLLYQKKSKQYLAATAVVILVSLVCYALSTYLGYRVIAFILLLTVSANAMLFDIFPVLTSAVLSAIVWDYFFIPPHYTLTITLLEDRIFFLMYFVIALINAALTYKIKIAEKQVRDKESKENSIKLYNTFLNSLSHELRTPISTIIGATDNLMHNQSRLKDSHKTELIQEISLASLRLNRQVENLLNMSRLESGIIKPKNDWCDINELVYDSVKQIEEGGCTQRISININPEIPLFKLDKGLLGQILYNIIQNATIYTPKNAIINVVALCHADILRIEIEDNGPGFPELEKDLVFEKFYRLKSSQPGGTGLGLSIVKGFVEAMKGCVALQNIPEGGARFTIEIPGETSYLKNLKNE